MEGENALWKANLEVSPRAWKYRDKYHASVSLAVLNVASAISRSEKIHLRWIRLLLPIRVYSSDVRE